MSGDSWEELKAHQADVKAFGGRIDSQAKGALAELSDTVLGSRKTLPTSGAVPISPAPITLAEMVVSQPVAVDVSFGLPNLIEGISIGSRSGDVGSQRERAANSENRCWPWMAFPIRGVAVARSILSRGPA